MQFRFRLRSPVSARFGQENGHRCNDDARARGGCTGKPWRTQTGLFVPRNGQQPRRNRLATPDQAGRAVNRFSAQWLASTLGHTRDAASTPQASSQQDQLLRGRRGTCTKRPSPCGASRVGDEAGALRAQRPRTYGQTLTCLQLPLCLHVLGRRQRLIATRRFLQPRSPRWLLCHCF